MNARRRIATGTMHVPVRKSYGWGTLRVQGSCGAFGGGTDFGGSLGGIFVPEPPTSDDLRAGTLDERADGHAKPRGQTRVSPTASILARALDKPADRWYAAGGALVSDGNFGLVGRANPSSGTRLGDRVDVRDGAEEGEVAEREARR